MGTDLKLGHVLGSHFGVNGLTPMTLTVRVQCPSEYATASTLAGQPLNCMKEVKRSTHE